MKDTGLEQQKKITVLRDQSPSGALVKRDTGFDIEVYKEVLSDRFIEARTVDEYEKLLVLRQRVQELDIEVRRLDYAERSAEIQLQQAQQKALLQRGQQIVAIIISIAAGLYLLQTLPLAGLLFLILGLAKPLGYSLGEIGNFLDSLKGFPKDSDKLLSDGKEQRDQAEESRDARP
ncbi:hypothetical protein [Brasilonema bromeliae]|uniref:Uncharacterized protein n=1 Tax=Brasilonema bromeliae SPC951 TaxID=385972 RepID=A0ABX1P8S2_9CYAN|nr:hypothetical protein [Brasilonema bromeliae]NMG20814.1 hypothetical protein [Brasilonema bromeliae SPC951]